MYTYTIISSTEFSVTNGKEYNINFIGDETLAISVLADLSSRELENNKAEKIKALHEKYQEQVDTITSSVPKYEAETWDAQKDTWIAWIADNTVQLLWLML